MFGSKRGNKQQKRLVGAKEKRINARHIAKGETDFIITKSNGQKINRVEMGPVVVCGGIAAVLATLLTQGPMLHAQMVSVTGIDWIDTILAGPGVPPLVGTGTLNEIAVILIRAVALMAVAGIVPLVSAIAALLSDRTRNNPFILTWGVILSLMLAYFLGRDTLAPIIHDIMIGG